MEASKVVEAVRKAGSLPELMKTLRSEGAEPMQLASAMKSYLQFKARDKAIPISGQFELTPLCNLDCKMCYVHLNAAQMRGQTPLSADVWEGIMTQAIKRGMMYATLTGGECLTYPEFDRLYLFLHRAGVQVSVLTNGVLLTEERIRFFQAHPPAFLQVTLYGSSDEAYERVTGHRMFETVMRHIRMADEAKLPVMISLTPNTYSGVDNERLVELAASTGMRFEINSTLMSPREETGRSEDEHGISCAEYFRLIKLKLKLAGDSIPEECLLDLPVPGKEAKNAPVGLRCGGGRSGFVVNWRGEMMPCNRLCHISADILSCGVDEAWCRIHDAAMKYPLPSECEVCPYQAVANACVAAHLPDATLGHASRKMCEWCRELIRSGLRSLN